MDRTKVSDFSSNRIGFIFIFCRIGKKKLFLIRSNNHFSDKVKFKFTVSINFNNWFVIVCYIKCDEPHHNEWCKLKFFINTCFTSVCNWCLIIKNMNELSMKTYDVNDELYTLWMWIILIINFNQNFNLNVFMFDKKCFIFYF